MSHTADSAGRPWSGRAFEVNPWAGDDGSAPAAYLDAVAALHRGECGPERVVEALADARLLMPMLAEPGEMHVDEHGRTHDRRAELALVTVAGPDGRAVLPAFSSAAAMSAWNPVARPVPAPARQVALGAASDGTELVVVDPGAVSMFVLRRGAVEALARGIPWLPPWRDPAVGQALRAAAAGESAVTTVRVEAADPQCTLEAPETRAVVVLHSSLAATERDALLDRLRRAWAADPAIRRAVDSLQLRLEAAFC